MKRKTLRRKQTRKARYHGGAAGPPKKAEAEASASVPRPSPAPPPPLEHMPQLCIGTGQYDKSDPGSIRKIIKAGLAAGYRHIDTADGYGPPEYHAALSDALMTSGVERHKLWITWKSNTITLENIQHAAAQVGGYIDLFLIHHAYSGGRAEQFDIFTAAQARGLIRHFGVSNCENIKILRKIKSKYPIFANQIQAAPPGGIVKPHHARPNARPPTFVAECNALGIAVMLYATMSGVNQSANLYNEEKINLQSFYFENSTKINRYYTQRYIVGQPNVLIVGTTSGSTLPQNMRDFTDTLAQQNLLSEEEMAAIEHFLKQLVLGPMNM